MIQGAEGLHPLELFAAEIEQETLEKRDVACHPLSAKELLVVAQLDVGLLRLPLVLPLQMEPETK